MVREPNWGEGGERKERGEGGERKERGGGEERGSGKGGGREGEGGRLKQGGAHFRKRKLKAPQHSHEQQMEDSDIQTSLSYRFGYSSVLQVVQLATSLGNQGLSQQ